MLYVGVLITPSFIIILGKHLIYKYLKLGHSVALHGITVSSSGHLVVGTYPTPAIHIYSNQGDYLTTISHTALGLGKYHIIWGIRCASNGLLHIAIGGTEEIEGQRVPHNTVTACIQGRKIRCKASSLL